MLEQKYTRITKDEIIDLLVEHHVSMYIDDHDNLADIIRYGFGGIKHMTNDDLLEQITYLEDPECPFQLVEVLS